MILRRLKHVLCYAAIIVSTVIAIIAACINILDVFVVCSMFFTLFVSIIIN